MPTSSDRRTICVDSLVDRLTETQARVMQALIEEPGLSREPISEKTGIASTTVHDALSALVNSEMIDKYTNRDGRHGRQLVEYIVNELGEIVLNEWYVRQGLQSS